MLGGKVRSLYVYLIGLSTLKKWRDTMELASGLFKIFITRRKPTKTLQLKGCLFLLWIKSSDQSEKVRKGSLSLSSCSAIGIRGSKGSDSDGISSIIGIQPEINVDIAQTLGFHFSI